MGNRLDKVIPEDKKQHNFAPTPTSCNYCSEKVRVESFNELQPGDHICQGGQSFIKTLNRNQKYLYEHHSIVKKVISVNGTGQSAFITLIHYYSTLYDGNLKIRETNERLDLGQDELYIVRYRHPRFQPNEVLERAQEALKHDPKYSLPFLNCEHFCTWCITGEEFSCQVERAKEIVKNIVDSLLGPGSKTAKLIIQLVGLTAADVANVVDKMVPRSLSLGATALSGVAIIIYLIRNIVTHVILNKKFKNGQICKNCYNFKVRSSWLSFTVFCIPTIASILIGLFITGSGPLVGIIVPLSIILLALVWGSTKAYKAVRSPFRGDKTKVEDSRDLREGDVIQYRYWKMLHEAIVLSVDFCAGSKLGKVHVVHYGQQSLFSKREIMEEELKIDFNKMEIFKLDYSSYTEYLPVEVVSRARQRVGEKKFGILTNRSCHFCHWAKVNESCDKVSTLDQNKYPSFDLTDFRRQIPNDQLASRPPSTSLIDITWIKIKSEVRGGDLIQFSYHGHWHKGICTDNVSPDTSRELKIKVVHYSYQGYFDVPEVREEIFTFDLSVENVYIYHYHPAHRYSRTKIIDRARKKIGEKKYSMLHRNSGHLVEEIALKDKEQVINSQSELCEGDIVSFFYWGIRHKAVLVSIAKITSDMKCLMTVIHYAAKDLFSTRTVLEETISIDLAGNNLRKLNFSEHLTFPGHIVVDRARKRLGEQKFHPMSNNSNHLVNWAKIDNQGKDFHLVTRETKSSIQMDIPDENQNQTSNNTTGNRKMYLYKEPVRSWDEFIPGRIVDFKYYGIRHHGILTEVNTTQERIKVVHYGSKRLFATRTILQDEMKVNLKKENFYIYHPDPDCASTPDEVIRNAISRLGEQKWGPGNRSYDFCKACVFGVIQAH